MLQMWYESLLEGMIIVHQPFYTSQTNKQTKKQVKSWWCHLLESVPNIFTIIEDLQVL